ncbi:MAG: glycosyltransferase family 39 protein [Anaerolineae bacterium]|nr:glycosyltransferase family 39 protein [Anaerolineae bacterium]
MRKRLFDEQHDRLFLLIGFAIALILRLVVALALPENFLPDAMSDRLQYHQIANNLLDNGVFGLEPGIPDQYVPPGYPAFLAVIYFFFGRTVAGPGVRIAQSVLGALATVLIFYLARRIYPTDRRVAFLAALAVALHPILILYCSFQLTETLYTLSTIAFLLLLSRSLDDLNLWWGLASGMMLGLAILVREVLVIFPLLIAALLLARSEVWRQRLAYFAVLILGTGMIISPWIARNSLHAGRLTFVTGRASSAAQMVTGTATTFQTPGETARQQHKRELDAARYATFDEMLDLQFALSDPVYYVWLAGVRFELTWLHPKGLESLPPGAMRWGYRLAHGVILLLGVVGVWEAFRRQRRIAWLLPAIWLYTITVHLFLSTAEPRYAVPVLPVILILAVAGVFWLWGLIRKPTRLP